MMVTKGSGYAILIADDDSGCRDALRSIVEPEGYRTVLAASGEEALDIVHEQQVDLALLDLVDEPAGLAFDRGNGILRRRLVGQVEPIELLAVEMGEPGREAGAGGRADMIAVTDMEAGAPIVTLDDVSYWYPEATTPALRRSVPMSAASEMFKSSASLARARLTRLLIVPTAELQTAAASS